MYEVKSNGDGTYSIYKNGEIDDSAKLKQIEQKYITTERNGHSEYHLTEQRAVITTSGETVSDVPVNK